MLTEYLYFSKKTEDKTNKTSDNGVLPPPPTWGSAQ